MNCKPGDIAVIKLCPPRPENVGRLITCVKMLGRDVIEWMEYDDVWLVEWNGVTHHKATGQAFGVPDVWLHPIRDPGDDAVDETLIYAGDPKVREVHA